jgi:hypothetical protein
VIAALIAAIGALAIAPLPARAEIPREIPSSSLPPPHLGYGMNVRFQDKVDLFAPLGFDWLKLWEEYGTEQNPTLPQIRYPYRVLFLIDCTERSDDLDAWGEAVETIAIAGRGLVEAYEICNEPNRQGWLDMDASPAPPDPGLYVQMLQVAYARIKAVDPGAIVVSAGLAPVGRIEGTCNGWSGSNCGAMDEREYARQMFLLGAGDYFDAFGYHPYGFAYAPETDPHSVSNGFAFRGVEVMHDLLVQHGLGDKPVWATEFSWLRDPNEDGAIPGWCHYHSPYEDNFGWMDVPEVQQANYITRAFQYADEHWPWMGAMFVWNLDWHDYNDTWVCEPARYFSVLKIDYTDYRPFIAPAGLDYGFWRLGAVDGEDAQPAPYTTTLAYDALAAMEKRLVNFDPRLAVVPPTIVFLSDVDEPGVLRDVVVPLNTGFGVFTWTATVAVGLQVTGTGTVGLQVTPTLAITTGLQGTPLTVTLDSTGYTTGTFTGIISVTATTTGVLDAPQAVPVTLHIVPELRRLYLPAMLRSTR